MSAAGRARNTACLMCGGMEEGLAPSSLPLGIENWNLLILTFSAMFRPNRVQLVVEDTGKNNGKPPPNPKSLPIFSHAPAGTRT